MTAEHSSEEGGEGLRTIGRVLDLEGQVEHARARAESAEAERDDLRGRLAAVEALAAEWQADNGRTWIASLADDLLAALANPSAAQGEGEA